MPQASDFRFPPAFLVLLYQCVGLGQRLEAIFCVAQVVSDFCQHGAEVWHAQRSPGGAPSGDPLAHLDDLLLALALHGEGPATQARSPGRPVRKALRDRERDSGLCLLMRGHHVPAQLRHDAGCPVAQTPDYKDATARVPTPGPRGCGSGLAPDTPITKVLRGQDWQATPGSLRNA